MNDCQHLNFKADVKVIRMTDDEIPDNVKGYLAEVEIHCAECFVPMQFIGVPFGLSIHRPAINPEGTKIRLPIRPV